MDLGLKYVVGVDGVKTVTIPDDRRAMVIAFVRDGGAKPPEELETIVQEGHDELFAALDGVSEAQAAFKPSADDWSILELMAHVVTVKRITPTLSRNLAARQLPPGFGPQFEEAKAQDGVTVARFETLAEARTAAQAAHDDLLGFIRDVHQSADVEMTFKHYIFGALNSREWAAFQRIHDGDHTPQIGSIKASPGYPAA